MAKKRSLLQPEEFLDEDEADELKRLRKEAKKRRLKQELQKLRTRESTIKRERTYRKSATGKLATGTGKAIKAIRSPTSFLYKRKQKVKIGRGRPKGSYDPRYAKYGGVYGFRKFMAQRRRLERIKALKEASVTPRQRQILQNIQERDRLRMQSPERRVVPDTYGQLPLSNIMEEIDISANIFP